MINDLPDSVEYINAGWNYNGKIKKLPKSLKEFRIYGNCNKKIPFPEDLNILYLPNNYKYKNIPKKLKVLRLGYNCHLKLEDLPDTLEELKIVDPIIKYDYDNVYKYFPNLKVFDRPIVVKQKILVKMN